MKIFFFTTMAILFCISSYGQTRKCTGSDGKVTYSDVACNNNTVAEARVNTNANTIDHSGMRAQVQNELSVREKNKADQQARLTRQASTPQVCSFSYYALGDTKGKQLAANAKAECLRNNEAGLSGESASNEHYKAWLDQRNIKIAERNGAIAASAAAAATNAAIQNSLNTKPKFTCSPGIGGRTLECQ